jgi:hypothetical protein
MGFDIEVLPQPYHMQATPAPRFSRALPAFEGVRFGLRLEERVAHGRRGTGQAGGGMEHLARAVVSP